MERILGWFEIHKKRKPFSLIDACIYGHLDVVKLFMEHGGNINAEDK